MKCAHTGVGRDAWEKCTNIWTPASTVHMHNNCTCMYSLMFTHCVEVCVYRVAIRCFYMFYMMQLCEYRHAPGQFSHMHRSHVCVLCTHAWELHSHMCMHTDIHLWIYIQVLDVGSLIHMAHENIVCSFTYANSIGHA